MRVLLCVALCAALGGCASVTRGTTETISVASTPSGAEATISGLEAPTVCTTPCAFVAKRSADITVTVEKPGYETQIVPLTKDIPAAGAAGFAGNILAGGIIGMGVDAATGAATDHKPNPVIVTLQPHSAAPPPRAMRPRRSAPAAKPEAGT
jgi:PEGA domain